MLGTQKRRFTVMKRLIFESRFEAIVKASIMPD